MTIQALEAGGPAPSAKKRLRHQKKRIRHRPPAWQPGTPYPLGLPIPDFRAAVEAEIGPIGSDQTVERLIKVGVLQALKIPGTKRRLIRVQEGLEALRRLFDQSAAASQGDPPPPEPDQPAP